VKRFGFLLSCQMIRGFHRPDITDIASSIGQSNTLFRAIAILLPLLRTLLFVEDFIVVLYLSLMNSMENVDDVRKQKYLDFGR
jgi:hypothetical protein